MLINKQPYPRKPTVPKYLMKFLKKNGEKRFCFKDSSYICHVKKNNLISNFI